MRILVSILIPAFERPDYLRRSLKQIALQSFRDFEVIVTDDSATDAIESFLREQTFDFPIRYRHNSPAKGTPLNWTSGIDLAAGEWIKILHDDDWLARPDSLDEYVRAIRPEIDLIFSGYEAVFEETGHREDRTISKHAFDEITRNPYKLFASNRIGPPSVLMFRRGMTEHFDPQLKWIVDWEGYIRMLQQHGAVYVDRPLICMSYNATQVTKSCLGNPAVEIPEALIFYAKHGEKTRSSWVTYDAWWRLMRNLSIRSEAELIRFAAGRPAPPFLLRLLKHQLLLPLAFWRIGVLSKFGMFLSYFVNR